MFIFAISMIFSFSSFASKERLQVPAVKIPSVQVGNDKVRFLSLNRFCHRPSTGWEQLNNAGEAWVNCNSLRLVPAGDLVIEADASGQFQIPAQTITYDSKRKREEVTCIAVRPSFELEKTSDGKSTLAPKLVSTKEELVYCTQSPAPDFISFFVIQNKKAVLLLKDFVTSLSKGVTFTPR